MPIKCPVFSIACLAGGFFGMFFLIWFAKREIQQRESWREDENENDDKTLTRPPTPLTPAPSFCLPQKEKHTKKPPPTRQNLACAQTKLNSD